MVPGEKVETDVGALRRELTTLRPLAPDQDDAVRVPAPPVKKPESASPPFTEPEKPATRPDPSPMAVTGDPVRIPVSSAAAAAARPAASPEATIGSESAAASAESPAPPGNQARSASSSTSGRGLFRWFKREPGRQTEQEKEISDPTTVVPVPAKPSDGTGEVIAAYPPARTVADDGDVSGGAHSASVGAGPGS